MAKAKSTPIAEKMQKSANALRAKAKLVREHKSELAEGFVDGFSQTGLEVTDTYVNVLEITQKALGIYIHGAKAANLVFKEIGSNPKLRAQVETLVANVVDDVSARLNEFANIIDSVSKSSEIQQAFEELREAVENLKTFAPMAEKMKRKFGKRKLHVVDDDDDGGDENTSTDRKRASGRKKSKH